MYVRSCAIRILTLWAALAPAGATLAVGGCSSNTTPATQAGQLQTAQSGAAGSGRAAQSAGGPGEAAQVGAANVAGGPGGAAQGGTANGVPGPGGTTARLGGGAAASEAAQPAQSPQQYRLTATIPDLMDGVIDPAADVLWDSVAYIATPKGIEDRQPRTADEWKTVRNSAITLIEAANLLSMPGRRVDAPHAPANATRPPIAQVTPANAPPPLGELSHAEIQQRIDASHDAFTQFARNLQDAGLKALAAITAKDAQRLMDAGGTIDEACEACHVTYWYPNQNRPGR